MPLTLLIILISEISKPKAIDFSPWPSPQFKRNEPQLQIQLKKSNKAYSQNKKYSIWYPLIV